MQEEKETTQIQPQFMKEEVYIIECACCGSTLCNRGMKSFLVADEKVELYSTEVTIPTAAGRITFRRHGRRGNNFLLTRQTASIQYNSLPLLFH